MSWGGSTGMVAIIMVPPIAGKGGMRSFMSPRRISGACDTFAERHGKTDEGHEQKHYGVYACGFTFHMCVL